MTTNSNKKIQYLELIFYSFLYYQSFGIIEKIFTSAYYFQGWIQEFLVGGGGGVWTNQRIDKIFYNTENAKVVTSACFFDTHLALVITIYIPYI